jgi:hypothetical protein
MIESLLEPYRSFWQAFTEDAVPQSVSEGGLGCTHATLRDRWGQKNSTGLGTMLTKLKSRKLWPIPDPSAVSVSVLRLQHLLNPRKNICGHDGNCMRADTSLNPNDLPVRFRPGLTELHERHIATQAKKSNVAADDLRTE